MKLIEAFHIYPFDSLYLVVLKAMYILSPFISRVQVF